MGVQGDGVSAVHAAQLRHEVPANIHIDLMFFKNAFLYLNIGTEG